MATAVSEANVAQCGVLQFFTDSTQASFIFLDEFADVGVDGAICRLTKNDTFFLVGNLCSRQMS